MTDTLTDAWAETEFGEAQLGDARRTARLVRLATTLGAQPSASLPQACNDPAALKAAYRFFANDDISPEPMLASHSHATYARLADQPVVLAVQDTTMLDWTSHPATTGLGPLASAKRQGLLAHTTLAITPERLPLGVLAQETWVRDPATFGQQENHKARPITEKESQKWLTSLQAVIAARAACPNTHFISVADREADVYDLFIHERPAGVDLLVRAAWDRRVAEPQRRLWASVAAAPLAATVTVQVPRRGEQPAREAVLTVRWRAVTLRPPRWRAGEGLRPVKVWAVLACEERPPAGVEPVRWLLLTTCLVDSTEDALERLAWYMCRWGIEIVHKVLKSGCQIEARQLGTAERLRCCLAIYTVVAWRVLYATMLARVVPDAPCTALLEVEEWQALYCMIHRTQVVPSRVPSLRQAVRWIARLGGFAGRKGDGEPGVTVLWRGFQRLYDLTALYRVLRPPGPS